MPNDDTEKNGDNAVDNEEKTQPAGDADEEEEDLEAQMADAMSAEGDGDDDEDLEAQMAAAMAAVDDDDDLESQMAAAMGDEGDLDEGDDSLMDDLAGDDDEGVDVKPLAFQQFQPGEEMTDRDSIDRLLDVTLNLSVELGRKHMQIKEILELGPGKIIELDKLAGEPVDLLVNGKLLARGEVVVVDENFGVRITDLIDPRDRIRSL